MYKEAGKNKEVGSDDLPELRTLFRNITGAPAVASFNTVYDSRDADPENNEIVERQEKHQIELRAIEVFVFRKIGKVDVDVQIV